MYDLKQSGLLIEFIATTKNSLGSYQLNEKFEWIGRWRLFEKARQAWNIKLKYHRGLASLPNAVTGDDERGRTGSDIAESPYKSIVSIETKPTLSRGLGASVYARTHMEKRLPPNMATTVRSSLKPPPIMATTVTVTYSHKKALKQRRMLAVNNFIGYRADNVYCALFERLAKSENPGVIEQSYFQLINHLAMDTGEPTDFVFQVLEGNIESLPTAAKIITFKGSCSVSALLNEIPAYPRTSDFLSKTLGKGKRKFNQSLNDENRPKVEPPRRSTLSVESRLSNGPEHRLTADSMSEGDNTNSSEMRRVDEMADYMQRVASIFKNPSA